MPSTLQSILVATQPYPSSPESGASTVCVDLDPFASEGSRSSDRHSPVSLVEKDRISVSLATSGDGERFDMLVSLVEKDRVSVSSVNSGDDEQTDMSLEPSRFEPLNHPTSPVQSGASQVVVELPSHYEALTVPVDVSALLDSVAQMSQLSALSSVQLSPNRVCEDSTCGTGPRGSPRQTGLVTDTHVAGDKWRKRGWSVGMRDSGIGTEMTHRTGLAL